MLLVDFLFALSPKTEECFCVCFVRIGVIGGGDYVVFQGHVYLTKQRKQPKFTRVTSAVAPNGFLLAFTILASTRNKAVFFKSMYSQSVSVILKSIVSSLSLTAIIGPYSIHLPSSTLV